MSETVIINAVYVAITPFFVEQGGKAKSKSETLGVSEMKVIRTQALGLVQTVGDKSPVCLFMLTYVMRLDLCKISRSETMDHCRSPQLGDEASGSSEKKASVSSSERSSCTDGLCPPSSPSAELYEWRPVQYPLCCSEGRSWRCERFPG